MKERAYPTAALAAETVSGFFARLLAGTPEYPASAAEPPDPDAVAAIVDAAFWASLRREEGRTPRISLALASPEQSGKPLRFAYSLPLAPDSLTRLAPAVERPGIHLAVWKLDGELRVWGATRTVPDLCFILEVVEPGLLVMKYRRGATFGKFGNIAVIRGNELRVVDEQHASSADYPAFLTAFLGKGAPAAWVASPNEFVQLAISMRRHGHGGAMIIVPTGSDKWRESIVGPVSYAVFPPFSTLGELLDQPEHDRVTAEWHDAVLRVVDGIGGLTAVDGATVMNEHHELLAFGAKLGRREGSATVDRISVTEPILGSRAFTIAPSQFGGTRHLSAAQFVHDQRDAVAMVASQDGRFTVFAWSPHDSIVQANRIEALLL
ncbi:MAG TPA: hypothetical protein VMM77_11495 [Gemmatimonadaceae bacterium]|nr:hypothetical protein [Gemmatimonadaceae bacterium]